MNLSNEWYYFTEAIDKKTCNKIIELGKEKFEKATIQEEIKNKKIRVNDISWSNDQWLYDLIWPYMEEANEQAGWKYDIKAAESIQITRYKKNNFYEFHKDGGSDNLSVYNEPENKFKHGNVRKLSMSIILNDNYEGGDFQFAVLEKEKGITLTPDFNKLGSIIVFPSFVSHRVRPIIKGIRYSLVSWLIGPPFK